MRKISIINDEIISVSQFLSSYEALAMRIAKLEKKYNKQIGKIYEILDKLIKIDSKDRPEIGFMG